MANIIFSENSAQNDSIFGKSQEPIMRFIETRGESWEAQSIIAQVFDMETSTHFGEKFTSMTAMDGFKPVGENGAYPVDGMQESYSKFLENVTWKNSFAISKEIIDDGNLMNLRKKPQGFVDGYYRTRERFGAFLFGEAIKGNTSAKFIDQKFDMTGADNVCIFATNHPKKIKSGTQSNKFSNAFSAETLGAIETRMQGFTGDNNELLDISPDTIIIPNDYALKNDVFAAIGADKSPDTANNAYNYVYGRWNIIVWPYLNEFITSGTKPWLLMDSRYNKDFGSAIWLDRELLTVTSKVADNDANVWKGRARYIAGFNDWRGFAAGGIAGATDATA